jgi:Fe-S-cluster containining protein
MRKVLSRPAPFQFLQKATDEFPYGVKEDGSCEKLEDNRCTVYDNRPLLCDIDRLAKQADLPMSRIEWYSMSYQGCNTLQMEIR